VAAGQDADHVGPEVVAGVLVLLARVAESDGQEVGGLARSFAQQRYASEESIA
jgi:hypothetical protein